MRKKKSKIWLCSREEFLEKINSSISLKDALSKFGLGINGNNHYTIKKRAILEGVDLSPIIENGKRNTKHGKPKKIEDVLVLDNDSILEISSHGLKLRLIKLNIFDNKCVECGLTDWNNKPISLHLDHKNGNRKDNRIENLRLLCPNCHSQTDNYAGKKKKLPQKPKVLPIRKTKCPGYDTLKLLVENNSLTSIGKQYGVGGNAVKKWCLKLNIPYHGLGFWQKQQSKTNGKYTQSPS